MDLATHRLFASCSNRRLIVVNSVNGANVAVLPIGPGSDADRFDPHRKLIFSSNGFDGTLSVIHEIDADTYTPVATIKTAPSGRTMALDPATGRVFIAAARTTSVQAWHDWSAAFRAGRRQKAPLEPNSLQLLDLGPAD